MSLPFLPDQDFAAGILIKFGKRDLKINMIKRLSSKSLVISIKAKSGAGKRSREMIQSLTAMVDEIKACSSVYSTPLRVNLYSREETSNDGTS